MIYYKLFLADPLDTLNPHLINIYSSYKRLLSERRNVIGMP